jgi:small subunit ribosomal protein S3
MGQKVNPISNRLGIIKGWDSNWYGGKNYADKIVEDERIRDYLNARLAKASIQKLYRAHTEINYSDSKYCRPGIIIGKGGQELIS